MLGSSRRLGAAAGGEELGTGGGQAAPAGFAGGVVEVPVGPLTDEDQLSFHGSSIARGCDSEGGSEEANAQVRARK